MKKMTPVLYQVYYMDNDRQRRVVGSGLSYQAAHNLAQKWYSPGLSCDVELEPDKVKYTSLESCIYNHY